ncbi:hypothetical protein Gogos_001046 [Gossypium gossypioides]|uniref:Uncharacterized protein n=1 Tax=Gossypium gossypioides TaxID=34282 RepID=A0A7J9CVB7_GOSGO|nr:hypothetical protein [Gossypium gossypioides]
MASALGSLLYMDSIIISQNRLAYAKECVEICANLVFPLFINVVLNDRSSRVLDSFSLFLISLEAIVEDEIARSKDKAIHVDDSAGEVSGAKSHSHFVDNEDGDGRQVSYPKKVRVASQGVANLMKAMKSKNK